MSRNRPHVSSGICNWFCRAWMKTKRAILICLLIIIVASLELSKTFDFSLLLAHSLWVLQLHFDMYNLVILAEIFRQPRCRCLASIGYTLTGVLK